MKKYICILVVIILCFSVTGCGTSNLLKNLHSSNSKDFSTDVLSTPIVHEVFKHEEQTDVKVLSVYNSVGNITIKQSDNEKVKVTMHLIQTKNLSDIDKKLDNLILMPHYTDDVVYYEPLYAQNTGIGYWRWIRDSLNANGIEIAFDIQIPSTIQEVRVFGEIGNISLRDITVRINAQTSVGAIIGESITPLDTAYFITKTVDKPLGANGVDITFANIDAVNRITAGTEVSNIRLNVPNNAAYTLAYDGNISTEYAHGNNTAALEGYIRELCFAPFEPLNDKQESTQIVTIEEKMPVRVVTVE